MSKIIVTLKKAISEKSELGQRQNEISAIVKKFKYHNVVGTPELKGRDKLVLDNVPPAGEDILVKAIKKLPAVKNAQIK